LKSIGRRSHIPELLERDRSSPMVRTPLDRDMTIWLGSSKGSGRRRTPFIRLKAAVFAPVPIARHRSEAAVQVGCAHNAREPWRMSANSEFVTSRRSPDGILTHPWFPWNESYPDQD
jgi:hypothetical protein